jgi:hypothetical protein
LLPPFYTILVKMGAHCSQRSTLCWSRVQSRFSAAGR